ALAAAGRTCLDLAHAGSYSQVGDARVIGFTGTVRDDCAVSILAGNLNAFERFRQSADLVQLDQNGVGDSISDALAEDRGIGDKVVVADQLNPASERLCHQLPAGVVVFGNPIFNTPDLRITGEHSLPEFDHLLRRLSAL